MAHFTRFIIFINGVQMKLAKHISFAIQNILSMPYKTYYLVAKTYRIIKKFFCTSYLLILSRTIVYENKLTYGVLTRLWLIKRYKITFILW